MFIVVSEMYLVEFMYQVLRYENVEEPAWKRWTTCVLILLCCLLCFCFSPTININNGIVGYSSFVCTTIPQDFSTKADRGTIFFFLFKTEWNNEWIGKINELDIKVTSHSCTHKNSQSFCSRNCKQHHTIYITQIVVYLLHPTRCVHHGSKSHLLHHSFSFVSSALRQVQEAMWQQKKQTGWWLMKFSDCQH